MSKSKSNPKRKSVSLPTVTEHIYCSKCKESFDTRTQLGKHKCAKTSTVLPLPPVPKKRTRAEADMETKDHRPVKKTRSLFIGNGRARVSRVDEVVFVNDNLVDDVGKLSFDALKTWLTACYQETFDAPENEGPLRRLLLAHEKGQYTQSSYDWKMGHIGCFDNVIHYDL